MLDLLSSLREKIDLLGDLLDLVGVCVVVWIISFSLQPLRTLRDTRDLLRGEYTQRYSADEEELDWIDELWMEDRR